MQAGILFSGTLGRLYLVLCLSDNIMRSRNLAIYGFFRVFIQLKARIDDIKHYLKDREG
jgi:hypothetical protein